MRGLALCSAALFALASARAEDPVQSVTRVVLPPEGSEHRPVAVPTEPENTVELDFPWPLEDWAGRGFTPDPDKYAGDFVIEATRGRRRIFVTPVSAAAHRVLHIVVAVPGGGTRGIPLEFVPAPAGLAWRKVTFVDGRPTPEPAPGFTLRKGPPRALFRSPDPQSLLGLVDTMRLMLNTTAAGARAVAASNPALRLAEFGTCPESFGDFTLTPRFALRDQTTYSLGICVSVLSASPRRLVLDPAGWVVRSGDRVYPVGTVDFPGILEPGEGRAALLVIGRAPDGLPTRLLPDNVFHVSARILASANPRPVRRMDLPSFGSR